MAEAEQPTKILLEGLEAFIFDMDGVVTDTAEIHASTWKRAFDEFLEKRAKSTGNQFQPFDIEADYLRYVDGKPRYEGVKSFLDSRDIEMPYGSPNDTPDSETICGLGNRKNRYYLDYLENRKIQPYESTIRLIENLKSNNISVAIISSSKNAASVLKAADIIDLFDARVDGIDSEQLKLKGKPDP
jgi:beta-phosphoglucomutase-like phosphatase (HAD superfamily)